MRRLLLLIIAALCFMSSAFAQTITSFDNTVSIVVPDSWYRSRCATAPNVENVLSVNYNKNIGINILRDRSIFLPFDFATIPQATKAKFIDQEIQIILMKYPNARINDVSEMTVCGEHAIVIKTDMDINEPGLTIPIPITFISFYFIKHNSLYTIQLCAPPYKCSASKESVEALQTLVVY